MKKYFYISFILIFCLIANSCGKKEESSDESAGQIFIYAFSTTTSDGSGSSVSNTCYGTSNGFTSAPFYSTSKTDLIDRLPGGKKQTHPVYSLQGHKIAGNWLTLFNNSQLVNSLHQAEVIFDNSSSPLGFWTGSNSDGKYSGSNCRDWSSSSSSDNSTVGSFLFKSPEDGDAFLDNGTKMPCNQSRYFLCFKYN